MFNHKFLLIALCCLLCGTVFANERSAEAAAEIAAQFTNRTPELRAKRMAPCSASSMRLVHTRAKLNSSAPAFYIFNQEDNSGYVVVSGDDYTEDILMYSDEGSLDYENINPNLRFWLNRLQEQISHASAANAVDRRVPAETTTAIAPLLKKGNQEIKWDQQSPYNNKCPTDPYDNTRCLTGCVATAAAMIMCKWSYPERGTGSRSYDWYYCTQYEVEYDDDGEEYYECVAEDSRTISLDFSTTTYDWANMKATYGSSATSAQKNAVATLMYHCGVACEMQYGGNTAEGSGSLTDYMGRGLVEHFGYRATKFVSTMSQNAYEYYEGEYYPAVFTPKQYSVSTTTLKNYFNADLEAGRPILMGGSDPSGGHEFVCDGRDTNNRFHINWGWSGVGNAYCHLSALILDDGEDQYNFSSNIDAMIGLEPNISDDPNPDDPNPDDPNPDTPTGEVGDFVLVTDASTLAVGDEVIIVNEEASVALSTYQKTNNRGQADVTIVDNTISLSEETNVQILTLKAGTVDGTYAFYTGEGYLYAASSQSNWLRTQTTNDDNSSWEISISGGVATIIAQGENTRNELRYNKSESNGQLFSCYGTSASNQQDVALYRRVVAEPDDPNPDDPNPDDPNPDDPNPDDPNPDDPNPDDPNPDDPDPDDPTGETGDFVLVTDASTLAVGDKVIIVNEEVSVALSTYQKTNNRGQADVVIVDNTISLSEETNVQILTLAEGTVEGTYAFYTGEGYLYAASSSGNQLKTQTTKDANGSWEITISDGVATIIAQGTNTHNWLRYNSSNSGQLFSCYSSTSNQDDVAIYRRVEPDDPDPETPTAVEAVDSRESIVKSSKVLRDGVLYIIRGDRVYDVLGRPANR